MDGVMGTEWLLHRVLFAVGALMAAFIYLYPYPWRDDEGPRKPSSRARGR